MKILYITSDFLFNIGGIFQHIENLTHFIAKNHKVIIIYLNKKNKDEVLVDENKRKIYFIPNNGSQLVRFLNYPNKRINEIIKMESPDLIHIHTIFDAIRLNKFKINTVFTNHSSSYLKMYEKIFMRNYILPKVMKKFKIVISPSTELFEKTPHENKFMIPNGVDISRFNLINREQVDKSYILKKYKINYSNQKIILSTRRLFDKNGILDFVISNISFFAKNKDFIYLIAGDGEHFQKIRSIIQDNSIDNIYLLGSLDNKEIDNLYYISDYCVIPSKMEAISISALESMASGTIVLANKVGGLAELIEDNINGKFLINLSLEKTLNDIDFKNNESLIKKNALKLVNDNYSWEKISNETIELYKNL
ncbi:MAG: glycosyltransferase family 4 protein [Candidatus Sericytochromatia bacterium]